METRNKRILFITGTRADFGKLKPIITKVEQSDEFDCHIFATGMHPLSRYGSTYVEIKKAGFKNVFLHLNQTSDNGSDMDMVLSNTIQGIGYYIREFPVDMIVVHGDRIETLAGAIVGMLNNIRVAHIEGGELSGTVDESIRHAVSKIAHAHFVANEEARTRLIQMGEHEQSIFVIGSPEVDVMLSDHLPSIEQTKRRYEIEYDEYVLFIYHSVTTQLHNLMHNIDGILQALQSSDLNYLVIYPNNDRGSEIIMEALQPLAADDRFTFFPSVRFEYFITLLRHAKAVVGNSSTGVREAPVFGIPTINIGNRQKNRNHHESIVNVSEEKTEIIHALQNIPARTKKSLRFGNGKGAASFMACLKQPGVWRIPCQKQFQDLRSFSSHRP